MCLGFNVFNNRAGEDDSEESESDDAGQGHKICGALYESYITIPGYGGVNEPIPQEIGPQKSHWIEGGNRILRVDDDFSGKKTDFKQNWPEDIEAKCMV